MEVTQGESEVPNSPVNGHQLTLEFATAGAKEDAVPRQSREAANRETTRYLAAATQVDTKYAANVAKRVFGEPLKALAPGYGIDIAVVARWALKALRTRAMRDLILAAVLILQMIFIALAITTSPWLLIALPLLFGVAWAAVAWEHWERFHQCIIRRLLRDRFEPGKAPPPKRHDERLRVKELEEREDGNLVVFSGPSAFVGTGSTVYNERILFDISYAPEEDSEAPARKGKEFTSHDIHMAIVEAFGNSHGLGRSLENIAVYERLFVNGRHVQSDNKLLPNPLNPPTTSIDGTLLASFAANPSHDARCYVCVEMPGWQGQLVVTLFARAVYTGKSLFVEWTFRVLPPLRDEFLHIDTLFEYPFYRQVLNSLTASLRATTPALLCSPVTALRSMLQPYAARNRRRRINYAIQHGYVFDYGALRSIREGASSRRNRHFFLARDENMYMLLAQQTLLQAVREFLSDHGVDLEKFDKQAQVIFDNSINIGNISGSSGIAVGVNTAATVNNPPEGKNE